MKYIKYVIVLLILLLFLPSNNKAYNYVNPKNEQAIKDFRTDIYHLKDLYDELVVEDDEESNSCTSYDTVYAKCPGVTVEGKGTFSLEDYVAGVFGPEFGGTTENEEANKAYTIAIRSYTLHKTNNCTQTIEASSNAQNFEEDITTYKKWVDMTRGVVATNKSGIIEGSYSLGNPMDCILDSSGMCTFKRCTVIPTSMSSCSDIRTFHVPQGVVTYDRTDIHYGGMEPWIAKYLAEKENYTTIQLLRAFYGDDVNLATLDGTESDSTSQSNNNSTKNDNKKTEDTNNNSCTLNNDGTGEYVNSEGVKFSVKNYNIEGTSQGLSKYFNLNTGNVSQCPWYAKYRAIEIVMTSSLSKDLKKKAKAVLEATDGNGREWYPDNKPILKYFKYSSDVTKPKAGSIVAWNRNDHNYGHVGIIEKVYSDGSVLLSEGWNRFGADSSNNENAIKIITRKVDQEYLKTYGGTGSFIGYTYLFSHKE